MEGRVPAPQQFSPHQDAQPPGGICLQRPFSLCFTGQEHINTLGIVLGVGLALLILVLFGYTFVRWYQRGQCWRREYGQSQGAGSGRAGRAQRKRAAGPGMWGAHLIFAGPRGLGKPTCRVAVGQAGGRQEEGDAW